MLSECGVLRLRGGFSNIRKRSGKNLKFSKKISKSYRIHSIARPHKQRHEEDRQQRRAEKARRLVSPSDSDSSGSDSTRASSTSRAVNAKAQPKLDTRPERRKPKKERVLRLGETTVSQVMNSIHAFKMRCPEVFKEDERLMMDNFGELMVRQHASAHCPFLFLVPIRSVCCAHAHTSTHTNTSAWRSLASFNSPHKSDAVWTVCIRM